MAEITPDLIETVLRAARSDRVPFVARAAETALSES
jgi:hypothetical protein